MAERPPSGSPPGAAVRHDVGGARLDARAEGTARHGVATPRGQTPAPGSRGGRFGRMFGSLPARDPGPEALDELADAMNELNAGIPHSSLPAGYTYLGQFVDHDLTFDPTSQFQRDNDPAALVNFRTPRFDLDSLYGSGPADQPYLYDWSCDAQPGVKLLLGSNPRGGRFAKVDLPRNGQGRALIGDARNDENLIVSQLHLLFVRFHNAVVRWLCGKPRPPAGRELREEAQRVVRWHYQWIVIHDLLPRFVGTKMAKAVSPSTVESRGVATAVADRRLHLWDGEPAIPVEFSGAVFRFAHSLVRSSYTINDERDDVPIIRLDEQAADNEHLGGFRRLPGTLQIQWKHFFAVTAQVPNLTLTIDERLATPLRRLPLTFAPGGIPGRSGASKPLRTPGTIELARLNLHRGRALGLPSGGDVAQAMGQAVLSPDVLLESTSAALSEEAQEALARATPLWFYVLRESSELADSQGLILGPVGGRIVGEVLTGLLMDDPQSYARQAPNWKPELPGTGGDFAMPDLVRFVELHE